MATIGEYYNYKDRGGHLEGRFPEDHRFYAQASISAEKTTAGDEIMEGESSMHQEHVVVLFGGKVSCQRSLYILDYMT